MRLEGGFIWNYEYKVQLNQSEIWAKASQKYLATGVYLSNIVQDDANFKLL